MFAKPSAASVVHLLQAANTSGRCGQYRRSHDILLVGEGDFSFAAALAGTLSGKQLVATSFDDEATVRLKYSGSVHHCLDTARAAKAQVHFGVDATRLHTDQRITGDTELDPAGGIFDRVIFNFPHAGGATRAAVARNRAVVAGFLASAADVVRPWPHGEIHVTMRLSSFYESWGVGDMAPPHGHGTGDTAASGAGTLDRKEGARKKQAGQKRRHMEATDPGRAPDGAVLAVALAGGAEADLMVEPVEEEEEEVTGGARQRDRRGPGGKGDRKGQAKGRDSKGKDKGDSRQRKAEGRDSKGKDKGDSRQRKAEGRRRLAMRRAGHGAGKAEKEKEEPFQYVAPPPSQRGPMLRFVGRVPFDASAYPGYNPVRTHPAARQAPEAGEAVTLVFTVVPAMHDGDESNGAEEEGEEEEEDQDGEEGSAASAALALAAAEEDRLARRAAKKARKEARRRERREREGATVGEGTEARARGGHSGQTEGSRIGQKRRRDAVETGNSAGSGASDGGEKEFERGDVDGEGAGAALIAMAALGRRRRGLAVGSTGTGEAQGGSHYMTDETDGHAWHRSSRKRRRKSMGGGSGDSDEDEASGPADGAGIAGGNGYGGSAMIEKAERRWAEMAIERDNKNQKQKGREGNQRERAADGKDSVHGQGQGAGGGKGRKGRKRRTGQR